MREACRHGRHPRRAKGFYLGLRASWVGVGLTPEAIFPSIDAVVAKSVEKLHK